MAPSERTSPIIAIVGGTGKTGKWALKGALQRGYEVRLLCRSSGKAKGMVVELFGDDSKWSQITVTEASVTDQTKLEPFLRGADTCISFLGMVKPPEWIVSPGVVAILDCLKKLEKEGAAGGGDAPPPPKFFSMSSIGLNESRFQANKAWGYCGCVAWLMIDKLLKQCFLDMADAESKIVETRATNPGLKLGICRATVLGDKKKYLKDYTSKVANYRTNTVQDNPQGRTTMTIDRQHVAECMLDAAVPETSAYDNKTISIFERCPKEYQKAMAEGAAWTKTG